MHIGVIILVYVTCVCVSAYLCVCVCIFFVCVCVGGLVGGIKLGDCVYRLRIFHIQNLL